MNARLILYILGWLLIFLGAALLLPIPFAIYYGDGQILTFLVCAAMTAGSGLYLTRKFKDRGDITIREGFGVVTFAWLAFAVFGGLPFLLGGVLLHPIDAFFESMSGFTTTGSTVITDLDVVPESILLWRSLTQWLGGMGFIVLGLAILPILGVGGMQLFEAEVPGPTADRLRPRIQDTAKLLWVVYAAITAAEVVLLVVGGMSFYEALCHSFTTMATGGFSTRDASVGGFDSSFIHVVITVFMFLAGVNFSLHFHAMRGKVGSYFKSEEFRFYLGVVVFSIGLIFVFNAARYGATLLNLRDSAFQVSSMVTTTGYVTADYERWPWFSQYVLVILMFIGGCAGSTGGGMKNVRILLLIKHSFRQISRLVHPQRVTVMKLDDKPVSDKVIQGILGFFALFIGSFVLASLALAALGHDLITSGASVIACLSNIGPGLGEVGPTRNFAGIHNGGKIVLSFCMLLGRLELYTVLVLIVPSFWRE